MKNKSELTKLVSSWMSGDESSGERLKMLIYNHCHFICKQHIHSKRKKIKGTDLGVLESLNTTSLLHNVLLDLVPPNQSCANRAQLFDYISIFIRNLMVDEIRKEAAQKRGKKIEHISLTSLMFAGKEDEFLKLDMALNQLAEISEEGARILNWRYFVGLSVDKIIELTGRKKSYIYKQIKTAKAFVISEMSMA